MRGRRAAKKRLRSRSRRAAASALTGLVGVTGASIVVNGVVADQASGLTNCNASTGPTFNYKYAFTGQDEANLNDYRWSGIERYISRPSGLSFQNNDLAHAHLLSHIALQNASRDTPTSMPYQMQTGFGIGNIHDEIEPNLSIYGEAQPYLASYDVNWWAILTNANQFQTVWRDGWAYGSPIYEADVLAAAGVWVQSVGPYAMAPALTNGDMRVFAETETYYDSNYLSRQPTWGNTIYFGGNNSHQYSTNWSLYKGVGGPPQTWTEWVVPPGETCYDPSDTLYILDHAWSMFHTIVHG